MISDAKSVAPDVGETVAAIEGLRAIILGEDGEVEDRGPLARPCDTPVHQCGGDARSLGGFGALTLVDLDGAVLGFVVTFDEITQLLSPPRTAALSDIPRRLPQHIHHPLTPLHLAPHPHHP